MKQGHRKFLTWHWRCQRSSRGFSSYTYVVPDSYPEFCCVTDSLPSSVTWKNDTCMFNNAITTFRPCRFSTYTMLYLWSPWFVCHIEQEHRYCLTLLLLLRTTSLCRVVLPLTVILYIYSYLVHLINVTTLCSSHLVQWGTLTVIHLSHACGIPSLTSSLTVPHPALFCHTSTAPYVMHYNFMLNTQVQSAKLRKLHNTVTMARHGPPLLPWSWRHLTTYAGWAVGEIQMHHISIKHTKIGSCSKDKR